ncbi:MAG: Na+/H+ antiporter NhaC family protein [Deltaproteobacteria bacterium]|nr:MAG: Na+/H+ antiporter NhaC family protein [Deltaproteobacteria bacterium]
MRDLSPTPFIRVVGFVVLGGLLWLSTSWLSPDPARLASITLEAQAKALFEGDGALPDDLVYGAVEKAAWAPPCDRAAEVVQKHAPPTEGAPTTLVLACRVETGAVTLTAQTVGGEPQVTAARHKALPDYDAILPPLLGILFALIFRQVLLALFSAVLLGALFVTQGDIGPAIELTAKSYLFDTVADAGNLYILGFTVFLVGMIHVCIRMGGMQGIVNSLGRIASGRRSAQVATGAVGVAIFFDDYANTVVVGSSVRPLTDSHRISREKLAYIVDSTAAPVAGLAVISTWIGVEIGFFNDQIDYLRPVATNGYDFFFQILPYRFYCIFALALVFLVAVSGRDFGPMLKAERRALKEGLLRRRETRHNAPGGDDARPRRDTVMKPGAPARWVNGVIPVLVVILGTFIASVIVGTAHLDAANPVWEADLGLFGRLREAFIAASDDTTIILFWSSFAGAALATLLAVGQRILTPVESLRAFFDGLWMVAPVIAILILAIALRAVTGDLGTSHYLVALIGDVPLWVLPVTIFGLAAFIAFSTGTSWGTMGILMPVAIPLVAALTAGQPNGELVLILAGSAVLDGAIFGDHCSLISDTTIMSSLSSNCDHVDHVRTQLPYALLAMTVAGVVGYSFMAWSGASVPVILVYAAGVLAMWAWLRLRGEDPAA